MQHFYLFANWFVAIALLSLGLAALVKSRRQTMNRVFALFTVAVSVWIIAAYISNDIVNAPKVSLIGNYVVFLFSYLSSCLLLWFAVALTGDARAARWLRKSSPIIVLVGLTSCTPLVVRGVHAQASVYAVDFGYFAPVYFIMMLAMLSAALLVLRKNMKATSGDQKSHLVILYRSMVIAIPILLLLEFILPAVTGWFAITNIGILAMAFPVLGLYYSVVRFKLFNLRLAIVRSLAYILTLGLIVATYSLASYYISQLLRRSGGSDVLVEGLNVVLIAVAVNSYQPLMLQFRRLTNGLFYRDAYDVQELFDDLNQLLVTTLDVDMLLSGAADIISRTLKPQFCMFELKSGSVEKKHLIAKGNYTLIPADVNPVYAALQRSRQRRILLEEIESTGKGSSRSFNQSIAIAVRLTPEAGDINSAVGYMLLGAKRSGNSYGSQDLRVLDTIINELIIAIQNTLHYEEIQNFNTTLQQRVDDATRKLRRTNQRLRELDDAKDDFVSMASHQLRTPLTSIKGYTSMVLEGDAGKINPMQKQLLEQSFTSAQRMVYLIADLLNVSRLKTGKFVIEPSRVNLADMVQQELAQLTAAAGDRQQTLEFIKPDSFPALMLDETKTRQVIMNFVDNAIYYTPTGGHITVKLVETPASVELRVTDTGIGVARSDQPHLFTKFYRAGNARKARPDGTGLGLFMAKKVVTAEGGAIIFETQEGKGSTFGFVFPKAGLLAEDAAVTPEKPALAKR